MSQPWSLAGVRSNAVRHSGSVRRAAFCISILAGCASSATSPTSHARLSRPATEVRIETGRVDVGDGHRLRYEIAGTGEATVVLEAGYGDGLDTWEPVFASIARFARVVRYDRAGYGASDPAVEPRSFTQMATELHTLLHAARVAPPYVLVGHSMGAAILRAFAHAFPTEVAGLVFVDPYTEQIFETVSPEVLREELARQDALAVKPAERAEWTYMKAQTLAKNAELRSFGRPPEIPMMLLITGRGRPPGWANAVLSQYGPWITDGADAYMVFTADSRHYIHRDEPELVLGAIRRVVFPSALVRLTHAMAQGGVSAVIAQYREMRRRYPPELLGEQVLNQLGYRQLGDGHVRDAIELFRLNVEMFPNAFNPHDSLGEAYMAAGERERAIASYRRSLELNPRNDNAVQRLKKLGASTR